MHFSHQSLEEALQILGKLLAEQGLHYEVVAVGGGSLLLLGHISRTTKDLDVVALVSEGNLISATPLPSPLVQAIHDVGEVLNLGKDWINTGPADLLKMGLPAGFKARLHTFRYEGLTIHLSDRFDQICFKLYAATDQGPTSKHFADLKLLHPTKLELEEARLWCLTQDVSEGFSNDLTAAISSLGDLKWKP